jgi:hypothetical protein
MFVTIIALLPAASALACSCEPPPTAKASLDKSAAVFSGKVLKIEAAGEYERAVTLEVTRAWKGVKAKEVVVYTANNGAACGFEFQKGKSYLIYAKQHQRDEEKEKVLATSICTRTALLAEAMGDVMELGEGKKPE